MSGASPEQVLRFWFGAEWFDGGYDAPAYERERVRFWFMGGAAVDVQCREFIPRIRKAGRGELHGEEWKSRDGLVAQLVLLDQFSRNAFRGAPEAFAYDARAVAVALQLIDKAGDRPASVPWPAALFIATCLMHSEDLAQHARVGAFCRAHVADSSRKSSNASSTSICPSTWRLSKNLGDTHTATVCTGARRRPPRPHGSRLTRHLVGARASNWRRRAEGA